jgi:hypothetical protein
MKRLTQQEIKEIVKHTKKGVSLNKITKLLGKNKTTIYYHFRKTKGKTMKPVISVFDDQELIGEFIGLVAGDGGLNKTKSYLYRTYLYFNITEKIYVIKLKKVLYQLFGKYPMQFRTKNVIVIAYYSKFIYYLVHNYLDWRHNERKSHSVHLKNHDHSKMFKIGFLRGCLDSDGYLADKYISFDTSSPNLAVDIKQFLMDLDIKFYYSVYKEKRPNRVNMYKIKIRKNERDIFLKTIKPRETKNLNAPAGTF